MAKWDDGDWIDFIVLRVIPGLFIILGVITLWAFGVILETVLYTLRG